MAIQDRNPQGYESSGMSYGMRPKGGDAENKTEAVMEEAKRKAYEAGEEFVHEATDRAKSLFDEQKKRAADELDNVADAFRQTSDRLKERDSEIYAHYAQTIAEQVNRASGYIRHTEIGEMMEQVENMARREPVLFFGSAFAAGFLMARLFRSSGQRIRERAQTYERYPEETVRRVPLPPRTIVEDQTPYGAH